MLAAVMELEEVGELLKEELLQLLEELDLRE